MRANPPKPQAHWITLFTLALAVLFAFGAWQGKTKEWEITVYKTPTCGCCKKWIDHLDDNGFLVHAIDLNDLSLVKDEQGLPPETRACHTAIVEGYVVEGHVPAEDIKQMLAARLDIRGLVVPGMPLGSPGMEERRRESYAVLALTNDGPTSVFAQH